MFKICHASRVQNVIRSPRSGGLGRSAGDATSVRNTKLRHSNPTGTRRVANVDTGPVLTLNGLAMKYEKSVLLYSIYPNLMIHPTNSDVCRERDLFNHAKD